MVCHLFLKTNPLAVLDRLGEMCNDFSPIRFAGGDYFFRIGMLDTGRLQIKSVKRLVNDNRIVPIAPRAHHGRRDISRTRPHGDANAHGLNSQAAKPRVQSLEDNVFHLGQVDQLLEDDGQPPQAQFRASFSRRRLTTADVMVSLSGNR